MFDIDRALAAEALGTFWLVLGGCGSAVLAATFPEVGIGLLGVSLAFGLSVLTMAYAIGPISGCHLNPAVTVGLVVAGRFEQSKALGYVVAQVVGAIVAGFVLYIVASGKAGANLGGFAANGFGELSPGGYGALAGLLIELVMTFMFLIVILGATSPKAPVGMAPIAIGLALTLIHLVSIPVTNTSVNPARSTSQAIFAGWPYLIQLPFFWFVPIIGALGAGVVWKWLAGEEGQAGRAAEVTAAES
jgi:aquaporin Z